MWTSEQKERLRALWAQGWTGQDIAPEIGDWCTPGAVFGQVRRLNLPPREYWVLRDRRQHVANATNANVRSATREKKHIPE